MSTYQRRAKQARRLVAEKTNANVGHRNQAASHSVPAGAPPKLRVVSLDGDLTSAVISKAGVDLRLPLADWLDHLDALLQTEHLHPPLVISVSFGSLADACGSCVSRQELESQLEARLLSVFASAKLAKISDERYAVVGHVCSLNGERGPEIIDLLSAPLSVGPFRFGLKISMGCCLADISVRNANDCLERSQSALLAAEQMIGPSVVFYGDPAEECLRMRARLQPVLCRGEYEHLGLAYQPIIDHLTGRTVGVEALARWHSPGLENLGAQTFISIAEACGQINAVATAVASRAIRECPVWEHGATMFINLSGRDLVSRRTMNEITEVIRIAGAPFDKIIFEFTETAVVDLDQAASVMAEYRAKGLRFAIDDFGAGESGLRRLARLPLDIIKIDGELVADISNDHKARCAVRGALELGQSLGLPCIVEGIETPAQAMQAALMGARYMQGYHFSKPLRPGQALEWVQAVPAYCAAN